MDEIINLVLMENTLLVLFFAVVTAVAVSKLLGKRVNLPPGPTQIPVFGNWLQLGNKLHPQVFIALARKLGDVFLLRMGTRNVVVVSSPELAKEVLVTKGVEFGSRTRNLVYDIFTGKGQDLAFADYGEHWRKMRRITAVPFFTAKAVAEHRRAFEDEAARLVDGLRSALSAEGVQLRLRLQLLMHNNMYQMMFGRGFESVDDPLFSKLYGLNRKRNVLAQSFEYNYGDFVPILRPFLRGYLKICKEVSQKRLDLYDYIVQEWRNEATSRLGKMGMEYVLEAEKKGEITWSNVLHFMENMNTAAIDSITGGIEWGVAELANHPRVAKKLQAELDTVLEHGVQITEPDMPKLPYLRAVVKEILRRHSAILLAPHKNAKAAKIGGYDIPAKSRVTVNAWWLANNPEHWKNPEEFRPERFLEEESHVEITGTDLRYIPFGAGRRSCPGVVVAFPIFCVTLGRLVQNFDFLVPPGKEKIDITETFGQFSLTLLEPLTIVMMPR